MSSTNPLQFLMASLLVASTILILSIAAFTTYLGLWTAIAGSVPPGLPEFLHWLNS